MICVFSYVWDLIDPKVISAVGFDRSHGTTYWYYCWNELPVELRDLTVSPATFAKHLKTHLFRVGFF